MPEKFSISDKFIVFMSMRLLFIINSLLAICTYTLSKILAMLTASSGGYARLKIFEIPTTKNINQNGINIIAILILKIKDKIRL
jgi:hypothetical protein